MNLPVEMHLLEQGEMMDTETRIIDPNYTNAGYGGDLRLASDFQRGVYVVNGGLSPTGALGETPFEFYAVPKNINGPVQIFMGTIRSYSPASSSTTTVEQYDGAVNAQTLGHEIGHSIFMKHWQVTDGGPDCPLTAIYPSRAVTVMVTCWIGPLSTWQSPPHAYDSIDLGGFRLK